VPLYEYKCPKCGQFELIQKFSDAPLTVCPTCGRKVQKLLSAPAIQFKGSGWYVTDYARKSSGGDGGKGEGSKAGDGAGKSEANTSSTTSTKDASTAGPKESTGKSSGGSAKTSGGSAK
jgi:putative FmdB family regulatory protein